MLIVQRPHIEEETVSDNRSRFVVEPLEPGFGHTLGNTLRRALLARIPGAAITSVRIEGVHHEFSTIEGVVEDVVDFILNLKRVVLRIEGEGSHTIYLSAKGAGSWSWKASSKSRRSNCCWRLITRNLVIVGRPSIF